jgi:integrase
VQRSGLCGRGSDNRSHDGRRANAIVTRVGNHTFRATGVTAYLKNGGTLEKAAQMANHASTRTTQLYDRRAEEVTLDEVERILV